MDRERLVTQHSDKLVSEAGDRQSRDGTDPPWSQAGGRSWYGADKVSMSFSAGYGAIKEPNVILDFTCRGRWRRRLG